MSFLNDYAIAAVILLVFTSLVLLAQFNWRWTLLALAVQYIAVAWLVSLSWPLSLAAIKWVVGWMAGAVLATSQAGLREPPESLSGRLFRLLAAGLVLVALYTVSPPARAWLQVPQAVLLGTLVLVGVGLVQISMTHQPLRVVVGLLTVLAGFEILYAALELSVLVAGLLAVINLGLVLSGAYLLITETRGAG
jgi:hypothetical protein